MKQRDNRKLAFISCTLPAAFQVCKRLWKDWIRNTNINECNIPNMERAGNIPRKEKGVWHSRFVLNAEITLQSQNNVYLIMIQIKAHATIILFLSGVFFWEWKKNIFAVV